MKLHYAGAIGGPFGWGICGLNLTRELAKFCTLTSAEDADIIFTPIADHELTPALHVPGKPLLGYTFFESPLGTYAEKNAKIYEVIFAGSTWCMERLAERGITNTALLIQGVDDRIFKPQPPRQPDGKFRIFSGGKFEYRKGQDLVIAAFRRFAKGCPEAHLVCSWFNLWPQLVHDLAHRMGFQLMGDVNAAMGALLKANGLREDQFTILPKLHQCDLALAMAHTDCGLFPNRCEGGTNLVMMEYAALGDRHVIANTLTGHADMDEIVSVSILAHEDENKWAEMGIANIVDSLKHAYKMRDERVRSHFFSWRFAARLVLQHAERLLTAKA